MYAMNKFGRLLWFLSFVVLAPGVSDAQVLGGYVHKSDNPATTVIVFIHGLGGNARQTWTNPSGAFWPDLVYGDPTFAQSDVLVVDYETTIRGEQTTAAVALSVDGFLRRQSVWTYQNIVLVAHSLGGIIARQIIVNNPAHAGKVKLMYLLAAPMGGSMLATYATNLGLAGAIVRDLRSIEEGSFLANLINQWNSSIGHGTIPTYCAVEGRDMSASGSPRSVSMSDSTASSPSPRTRSVAPPTRVVDYASSALLCNRKIVSHNAHDHESIAKPSSTEDGVHIEFRNAFLTR
jgi:pimeloyl-ACP methyl ester carboxylesterase